MPSGSKTSTAPISSAKESLLRAPVGRTLVNAMHNLSRVTLTTARLGVFPILQTRKAKAVGKVVAQLVSVRP